MEQLIINGGNRLSGEVEINGAKNAVVAVLSATVAANGVCVVDNLPCIEDTASLVSAISDLGAVCEFRDKRTLVVDSRPVRQSQTDHPALKKIRGGYYLLGALLGRFKSAEVPLPGGCDFGARPIDLHVKGLTALGAKVKTEYGMIKAEADQLTGASIYLDIASVGATINIMLAAVHATGTTVIENAAKEPHVVDTANFLNMIGANIKGAGTDIIRINGVKSLHGGEYTIIPDQIETGTYMIAAAITGGDVVVRNIIPKHMDSLAAKLIEMNCKVQDGNDYIRISGGSPLRSAKIKTSVYPGFPTDLQPQMTTLLCVAQGNGMITETVTENRFQYVTELKRLGADITVEGRLAVVRGGVQFTGTEVNASDLRAGVALVLAGLAAKGKTTIGNVRYIDRGYENIETKLSDLGADIRRVHTEDRA